MLEKTIQGQLPQSSFTLDQDQRFYDVILQISDVKLYCHRFILAAFSPFFEAMFTNDMMESKQKLIQLKEIDSQATTDIIRYMYGQQLKITPQNAQSLAVTASRLLVTPVVEDCCAILFSNIDIDNIIEIYTFGETYQVQQIIDASCQFIISNFKACTEISNFDQIPPSILIRCLQSNELCISDEADLLYIVERWYKDHKPQGDDTLLEIFENIRLPIIPMDDLTKFEQNTKLFDVSTGCLDLLKKAKAFYETPERHFSKLCQLNYRYHSNGIRNLGKTIYTLKKEETMNRIHYADITIGHKLFRIGGITKGTYKYCIKINATCLHVSKYRNCHYISCTVQDKFSHL